MHAWYLAQNRIYQLGDMFVKIRHNLTREKTNRSRNSPVTGSGGDDPCLPSRDASASEHRHAGEWRRKVERSSREESWVVGEPRGPFRRGCGGGNGKEAVGLEQRGCH